MQHSFFGRLLLFLGRLIYHYYDGSALALVVRGLSEGTGRLWRQSLTGHALSREGTLSRSFPHSLFAKALEVILNLPGLLFRAIYRGFYPVFRGSLAARVVFGIAENTPIAAGWMMLLFLVLPYEYWNNAYSLMGFSLLLILAMISGMRRKNQRLDLVSIGPYVLLFAAFVTLAWPLSTSAALSQRFFLYHLSCMLCVLVIVSTVQNIEQLKRLAGMTTLAMIASAAFAVLQRMQGIEVNPSHVDVLLNEGMPGRVYTFFENPNAYGEVLVLLIPLSVGLMFASRSWLGRFSSLFGAAAGTMALIMTYSRAGWIGLVVAALFFILLWKRKILPLVLIVGAAAIPFLPDVVFNRIMTIFNMNDTSTSSRFPLYEAAIRLIQDRPLRGTGLGSDVVRQVVKDSNLYYGEAPFVHSHNVYLQVWAETGLFGLLSLLGSAGWTIKRAASTAFGQRGSYPVRMIIIGGVSSIVGILVCGLADFIWHYPRVMLVFWYVFGITLAAIRLAHREEKRASRTQAAQ